MHFYRFFFTVSGSACAWEIHLALVWRFTWGLEYLHIVLSGDAVDRLCVCPCIDNAKIAETSIHPYSIIDSFSTATPDYPFEHVETSS
jgi:hypothetical protein